MYKKVIYFTILALVLWGGCDDSNTSGPDLQDVSSQKQFVWNAMNFWYFWQEDVPELEDNGDFFANDAEFRDFLISFTDARALFNELLFTAEDDFSFFIEDFEEFRQSQQGIERDFGFDFGLVRISDGDDIFGYVRFVLEGSPADTAGLVRGDIFTGVNGTQLNINNFREVLDADTYTLTMADIQDGSLNETGETIRVESTILQEDPIFINKVIEQDGIKAGYLMYNAFQTNSHEDLNTVFSDFIAAGIDELVLDLRYNSGGAVITSTALSTMISGENSDSQFARFTFNSKRSNNNDVVSFLDELPLFDDEGEQQSTISINKLAGLDRVFILTGTSTASASEALINGLRPFMEVILIGRQTVGKDEGSITLFDATEPFTNREQANPNHRIAIQPIVLKIVNANGEDFPFGFEPDVAVNELEFLEDLPPLGDPADPLLSEALSQIAPAMVTKTGKPSQPYDGTLFMNKNDLRKGSGIMYLLPDHLEILIKPESIN